MFKDEVLDELACKGANIAQFVSFAPSGEQRLSRVSGLEKGHAFDSVGDAVCAIHRTQAIPNVNIRTFLPDKPDGNPFLYGPSPENQFHDPANVRVKLSELLEQGYYAIINETIDSFDGGFSGVVMGDAFEFSSCDIPRCVEKPGCARLSRAVTTDLIAAVYGFNFSLPFDYSYRVECSVHPGRVGYFGEQYVIWQAESVPEFPSDVDLRPRWPNRYSRDMGDKAFGVLVAHLLGFPVPHTTVLGRIIPPFSFGIDTGSTMSRWVRTCPRVQEPGHFTTAHQWLDPYKLMHEEDPSGERIASLIWQQNVEARYAGSAITDAEGNPIIEGVTGYGDAFMVGARPSELPTHVVEEVRSRWSELCGALGDVRFEWVYDGKETWIVQLHSGRTQSVGDVIYPGDAEEYLVFNTDDGLESLRALIAGLKDGDNKGITLRGDIGLTSHFGDLLRRNKIPSRIKRD